jgi:hypothetical protein
MADKQFLGIVKEVQTKFGTMTKISIPKADFDKYVKNGWVNLVLKSSQSGKKYLEVDTFEPKEKAGQSHTVKNQSDQFHAGKNPDVLFNDDMPF